MPGPDRTVPSPDRRLADGLRRRDPAALDELHARCAGTSFGFLVRTLGDRAAAEDVFQQVFLEAWQRGAAYDPDRAGPMTWVMSIARSRASPPRNRAATHQARALRQPRGMRPAAASRSIRVDSWGPICVSRLCPRVRSV